MNLSHDAMLVSLRITAWSGRLYDRQASNHVAAHHDASASAGRYNKRLLPKAAFAALTATISKIRSTHYEQTLPWDDQGSRMLTVANYERYTELLDGLRERMVRERARFIEDYDDNIDQARLDLGKLFRIEDYPVQGGPAGPVRHPLPHRPGPGRRPLHGAARLRRHRRGSSATSSARSRNACTTPWATSTGASARRSSASRSACRRARTASRSSSATR